MEIIKRKVFVLYKCVIETNEKVAKFKLKKRKTKKKIKGICFLNIKKAVSLNKKIYF